MWVTFKEPLKEVEPTTFEECKLNMISYVLSRYETINEILYFGNHVNEMNMFSAPIKAKEQWGFHKSSRTIMWAEKV
jgi:hypothetical protein